jgi:hypothetical protein
MSDQLELFPKENRRNGKANGYRLAGPPRFERDIQVPTYALAIIMQLLVFLFMAGIAYHRINTTERDILELKSDVRALTKSIGDLSVNVGGLGVAIRERKN